ncbi:MAG: nucleotidyltransferase domain-containing protein [Nitrospirae bacterium]|nr:nucleotidyltransferase domain-containing protein [Nitrospirota bacterium]MDA8340117.1 nucleotidyltransferase domain-containing protein [Nitrospiraceae bacterium]
MISDEQINLLNHYFKNRSDIAFAFLFGSQARGTATKLSDVDIAVYFYPEKRHPVEYEEEKYYEAEDEIWADIEQIVKKEVELLVLNRVSSTVAASAIRGIPLAINDWGIYLDFMEVITAEADDFMDFVITDYKERISLAKGI